MQVNRGFVFESLKQYTTVVADIGDIEAIARHRPQDATTNPSLLFHAAQMPVYRHLVEEAGELALERGGRHEEMAEGFCLGVRFSRWSPAASQRRSPLT